MPDRPSASYITGSRRPARGTGTLLLAALLMLAASCASQGAGQGQDGGAQHGGGGSAPPAGTARPEPPTNSTSPAPAPSGCAAAPTTLTIQARTRPAPVCLRVGQPLTITAPPSSLQPWQPPISSDPTVLACTTQPGQNGASTTVCRALTPGTTTVNTITAPFRGDTHGPVQYVWTVTVHVQAV